MSLCLHIRLSSSTLSLHIRLTKLEVGEHDGLTVTSDLRLDLREREREMAFSTGDIWNLKLVILIFNVDADLQIDISANGSSSIYCNFVKENTLN